MDKVSFTLPTNIAKACASEQTRYAIAGYSVEPGKDGPYAVATNGRTLAVVRLTDTEGFPKPKADGGPFAGAGDQWPRAIVPKESVGPGGSRVTINGRIEAAPRLKSGKARPAAIHNPVDGQFPPHQEVYAETEPRAWVGLNAKLLRDLADAIGSDGVVSLGFKLDGRGQVSQRHAIAVLPNSDAEAVSFGIIMPCTTGDHADMTAEYRKRAHDSAAGIKMGERPTMPANYLPEVVEDDAPAAATA